MMHHMKTPSLVLSSGHCVWGLVISIATFLLTGCGDLRTEYGDSRGSVGQTSLNGFGGLRNAFEDAGVKTRDITRLTPRVRRSQTIVWTPKQESPIEYNATRWFENWLAAGNRTLVYIVPDSGSEVEYWRAAASLAEPKQRLQYRKRLAENTNTRMQWQLNRRIQQSNGWFKVQPDIASEPISNLKGEWSKSLRQQSPVTFEFTIAPYDKQAEKSGSNGTTKNKPAVPTKGGQTGPSSSTAFNNFGNTDIQATKTEVGFESKLASSAGNTVVAAIKSEKWNDSRIIVIAGGSLLTNYGLTEPLGGEVAKQLIAESTEKIDESDGLIKQVGFLTTDWQGVSISDRKPGVAVASGMEMLTVWPLSLVTIHAVLLGLVVCLMLFPTFGRPRKMVQSSNSDFAAHLDAVAALMNKSGGEPFARQRISEYFRRMHGEQTGPWILPENGVIPENRDSSTSPTMDDDSRS